MYPELTTIEAEQLTGVVIALQQELARLQDKVHSYYYEELVLRGDKNLNKEYKAYFKIT